MPGPGALLEHRPQRPAPEVDVIVVQVLGVNAGALAPTKSLEQAARLARRCRCCAAVGRVAQAHHDRRLKRDRRGQHVAFLDAADPGDGPGQRRAGESARTGACARTRLRRSPPPRATTSLDDSQRIGAAARRLDPRRGLARRRSALAQPRRCVSRSAAEPHLGPHDLRWRVVHAAHAPLSWRVRAQKVLVQHLVRPAAASSLEKLLERAAARPRRDLPAWCSSARHARPAPATRAARASR